MRRVIVWLECATNHMIATTTPGVRVEPRDQNALGIWLKDQRLAARLTQRDVAAAGISTSMLSRIEGGLTRPSYRTAVRLASALDVTLNDMAVAYRESSDSTHQLVTVLVHAGVDRKDALAIQSRLSRPLRDALVKALGRER